MEFTRGVTNWFYIKSKKLYIQLDYYRKGVSADCAVQGRFHFVNMEAL